LQLLYEKYFVVHDPCVTYLTGYWYFIRISEIPAGLKAQQATCSAVHVQCTDYYKSMCIGVVPVGGWQQLSCAPWASQAAARVLRLCWAALPVRISQKWAEQLWLPYIASSAARDIGRGALTAGSPHRGKFCKKFQSAFRRQAEM